MNCEINKIKSHFYTSTSGESKTDASFFSLMIGLKSYFETYHCIRYAVNEDTFQDEDDANYFIQEQDEYIKCYINIAIHIQHFFELEIKKILESVNILFSIDTKGDAIITYKTLNNIPLNDEEIEKLKAVEFSDAISRLKKLVDSKYISNPVANIMVNNQSLLTTINFLRNTTLHRGRKILKYCSLDMLMTQNILPLLKQLLELEAYSIYSQYLKQIDVYRILDDMINEGKKPEINFDKIAFYKDIGRCRFNKKYWVQKQNMAEYIDSLSKNIIQPAIMLETKCPCCGYKAIYKYPEFIDVATDEIGDETSTVGGFDIIQIPIYEEFAYCEICGLNVNSFMM